MKLILKKISATLLILTAFFFISNATAQAFQIDNFVKESGLKTTGVGAGFQDTGNSSNKLELTIAKYIKILLSLVGIVFLVLMLFSGYVWMMAKGEEKEIEKAKENIKSALIGLIIIFSAYAIIQVLIPLIAETTTPTI